MRAPTATNDATSPDSTAIDAAHDVVGAPPPRRPTDWPRTRSRLGSSRRSGPPTPLDRYGEATPLSQNAMTNAMSTSDSMSARPRIIGV